jgi:hypothetical protein
MPLAYQSGDAKTNACLEDGVTWAISYGSIAMPWNTPGKRSRRLTQNPRRTATAQAKGFVHRASATVQGEGVPSRGDEIFEVRY